MLLHEEVEVEENHVYLYFVPHVFLHAVTFRHVLHLDVISSQIELKLKVKTKLPYVWL